jgi:two-component system phosphate regulon sensor histidine kinase PhoR
MAMWPALAIVLLLALGLLQIWWWRRCQHLQRRLAEYQRASEAHRNQAEQAVARERTQQEALFNNMIEGVLVLDADGRVQLINQALKRLFNLANDIRGRTLLEAFRRQELIDLVRHAAHNDVGATVELELAAEDRRFLQASAAAFRDPAGRLQGTILVFHDLTRLKELEDTRQEFVANVSHELRTPLSMIKGFVETLLDGAKDDPAAATRFLQIIRKHTDRLTFLIEDLLTLSQLESKRIAFDFQALDLRAVADRVLEDLSGRAAERKVNLQNEVPAGLTVRADGERLPQVLFNLVENAIKYGRVEGQVELGARTGGAKTVQVWVHDNGPGIPPEALGRVFERFYRVDKARSREQGGTGLGLAIVKHLVLSHGGQVWVESQPGQGATFFFTLPLAD